MSRSRVFGAALLTLTLAASGEARADTYLSACAQNGVIVTADLTLTYDGLFPGLGDSTNKFATDSVVLPGTVADAVSPPVPPLVLLPATGDPKPDMISAVASSRFEFGTPSGTTPLDTFEFDVAGNASALGAFNSTGNPADAVVHVAADAVFFVDPAPAGACPGKIQLAALRTLLPYETTLKVTVTENPFTTPVIKAVQVPGSPEVNVIVNPSNTYRIDLVYEVRVPHGIDPPFGVTIPFSVKAVNLLPTMNTPAALVLALLIGATAVLFRLRTRTS